MIIPILEGFIAQVNSQLESGLLKEVHEFAGGGAGYLITGDHPKEKIAEALPAWSPFVLFELHETIKFPRPLEIGLAVAKQRAAAMKKWARIFDPISGSLALPGSPIVGSEAGGAGHPVGSESGPSMRSGTTFRHRRARVQPVLPRVRKHIPLRRGGFVPAIPERSRVASAYPGVDTSGRRSRSSRPMPAVSIRPSPKGLTRAKVRNCSIV